jgi:hypothetical protein
MHEAKDKSVDGWKNRTFFMWEHPNLIITLTSLPSQIKEKN